MIDSLLAEIAALGWLLNNCYQYDAHLWRVNLRRPDPNSDGDWFTDWAEAPTLAEALEDCMIKMIDAEYAPTPEVIYSNAPKAKVDLSGLLKISRPKVERRI